MYGTVFFETSALNDKNIEEAMSSLIIASLNKLSENGQFGMRDESGWPYYIPSISVVKNYCKLQNHTMKKSEKLENNKNCTIQ